MPASFDDASRNNPIVAFLAMGEGWHNNHHAFPASARHGLRWWEFDASYLLIRAMSLVGLARDIKLPSAERVKRRRRAVASPRRASSLTEPKPRAETSHSSSD